MHGGGVCMTGGGMCGRGHVWQGVCAWHGGVHERGHAWQGGMCGKGACMAGGHAWWGACVAGGMHVGSNMHGRGEYMAGACMVGGMCGRGCAWQGEHAWQWGTCMARGKCMAGEAATAADGTHPTRMHSCFLHRNMFKNSLYNFLFLFSFDFVHLAHRLLPSMDS